MEEILRRFRENQTWMEPFEAESAWGRVAAWGSHGKNDWGERTGHGRTSGGDSGSRLIPNWLLQRLRRGIYKDAADIHQWTVFRVV